MLLVLRSLNHLYNMVVVALPDPFLGIGCELHGGPNQQLAANVYSLDQKTVGINQNRRVNTIDG